MDELAVIDLAPYYAGGARSRRLVAALRAARSVVGCLGWFQPGLDDVHRAPSWRKSITRRAKRSACSIWIQWPQRPKTWSCASGMASKSARLA